MKATEQIRECQVQLANVPVPNIAAAWSVVWRTISPINEAQRTIKEAEWDALKQERNETVTEFAARIHATRLERILLGDAISEDDML